MVALQTQEMAGLEFVFIGMIDAVVNCDILILLAAAKLLALLVPF